MCKEVDCNCNEESKCVVADCSSCGLTGDVATDIMVSQMELLAEKNADGELSMEEIRENIELMLVIYVTVKKAEGYDMDDEVDNLMCHGCDHDGFGLDFGENDEDPDDDGDDCDDDFNDEDDLGDED